MNVKPSFLDRHPSLVNIPVGLGGIAVVIALIISATYVAGIGAYAVGDALGIVFHEEEQRTVGMTCLLGMLALIGPALTAGLANGIGRDIIKAWNDSRSDR